MKLQAAPEKERLAAEAELKEAELALKAAQAKQASLAVAAEGDNLFWVTAPRAGTVVELDVFASQEVGPDRDKPLLRISDLDEVLVIGDVPERDALGPEARACRREMQTELGTVARDRHGGAHLARWSTRSGHTVEVRIRVQNEDRVLRPNAFVEVTPGVDESARYVRVPSEAVVTEGEQLGGLRAERPAGAMVRTPVTLGPRARRPGRAARGARAGHAATSPRARCCCSTRSIWRSERTPWRRLVAFSLKNKGAVALHDRWWSAVWGWLSFRELTIEAFPDPTDTQVNVITLFAGQPAEEVERQIGLPLERALNGTPGLVAPAQHLAVRPVVRDAHLQRRRGRAAGAAAGAGAAARRGAARRRHARAGRAGHAHRRDLPLHPDAARAATR